MNNDYDKPWSELDSIWKNLNELWNNINYDLDPLDSNLYDLCWMELDNQLHFELQNHLANQLWNQLSHHLHSLEISHDEQK